jgi:predicted aminopeptidase
MDEGHGKEDSPAAKWRNVRAWGPGALVGFVACLLFFASISPFGRYILRAGWEETKILLRRKSIAIMVAGPNVPPAELAKLKVVAAARLFARDSLGLDAGESFTTYSPLDRDTLVLVLSAAYRDRLAFHRWWFPIVGRVPYKGYFDFAAARRAEEDFQARGFDTNLRPASAFSTLGWFNDPVVSTTLRADSLSLANTVLHELTHNTFFAKSQVEFNESFANFVGSRGSAEFYRKRGSPRVAAEADARWSDDKLLAAFWRRLHHEIDSVFKAHPGDSASHTRIVLRDSVYADAKRHLVYRLGPMLRTVSPRSLERTKIDNATVLSGRIYLTDLDLFDSVYVREGRNIKRAFDRVVALADAEPKAPFVALRRWVAGPLRPVGGAKTAP